jgi:hypothetical protein
MVETVRDTIEALKAEYQRHFGVPHSNKAYTEQSKSIKGLIAAVGHDNIIRTFRFLLECNDPWLQNAKNIGGLIKWYDAIQTMRLNTNLAVKSGSYKHMQAEMERRQEERLAEYRKEMLDE